MTCWTRTWAATRLGRTEVATAPCTQATLRVPGRCSSWSRELCWRGSRSRPRRCGRTSTSQWERSAATPRCWAGRRRSSAARRMVRPDAARAQAAGPARWREASRSQDGWLAAQLGGTTQPPGGLQECAPIYVDVSRASLIPGCLEPASAGASAAFRMGPHPPVRPPALWHCALVSVPPRQDDPRRRVWRRCLSVCRPQPTPAGPLCRLCP
mmetsp:Transcript_36155/g.90836  ORF Transcript_36155/g.90836 Transcript_36155/m.90836 type:complete len:211 (-) Transcript_36155:66-698(-)